MNSQIDVKRKPVMLFKGLLLIATLLIFGVLVVLTQTHWLTRGGGLRTSLKEQPKSNPSQNVDSSKQQNILQSRAAQEELQSDLARIEVFRRARDLDGLIITADELEEKWSRQDGELYGRLMLNISNIIANGFDDERIYTLSQKYAAAALAKADKFSLQLEAKLLEFIAMDIASVQTTGAGDSDWVRERSTKAKLWLHAWQRLERGIDKDFDFNDAASLNVCPPAETGLPCGIAPEVIKDPKLRAEYEASITANNEKARRFNQQYNLRLIGEYLPKEAEQYLTRAYSKPPYNLEELKGDLDEYLTDKTLKARIVNEVKKNMSSKQSHLE
jgi:hypothetical protein